MKEPITFLRESRKDLASVGAICPSSSFLAKKMVVQLQDRPDRPIRVLEAGAGTGAITHHLIKWLRPKDRLDVYEINPSFAQHLKMEFQKPQHPPETFPSIHVFEDSILNIQPQPRFDYIISGLPFNSFDEDFVASVLDRFCKILRPGGSLSFFEYLLIRELTTPFGSKEYKRRTQAVEKVLDTYVQRYQFKKETIFLNIPPAVIRYLRLPQETERIYQSHYVLRGNGERKVNGKWNGRR